MRARLLTLVLIATATAAAPQPAPREFVQAVEFPYYLYPRQLWERELAWMKAIGIRTVEFSIPWNWHQVQPGRYDLTGATAPRRDLAGLIRTLRRLNLHAWVRPLPPTTDWPSPNLEGAAQRVWLKQLEQLLATQTVSHGGPLAYTESPIPGVDAAPAPAPYADISATDAGALAASRDAVRKARKAIVWRRVEDSLYPAGWTPEGAPFLRRGAVGLDGQERPATGPLRREAALLRNWGVLLPGLEATPMPKPLAPLPPGVTAFEVTSAPASAVSITNGGEAEFHDDLRVTDPLTKKTLVIPGVRVAKGESLWLPVNVSIGPGGLCRDCSHFSAAEHIIYATAELLAIEYENGILAMEFAAPEAGEVVLQLAREPVGPFLAAGKPMEFEWDDKALRARLKIPAGRGADRRVRIGIAIEEPETSGFFNEAHRLIIGQTNVISTTYSSKEVAGRSRLRVPAGFTFTTRVKTPNEIDYEVAAPADLVHGDWATLALEADGLTLGTARLQLFRPASVRLADAIRIRFGATADLPLDPPVVAIEQRASGANVDVVVRNNSTGIQTFRLEASGDGLEFLPAKTDVPVGAMAERTVSLRVFSKDATPGLRDWRLKVGGGASLDLPMRALMLPRGRTVAWSADLDGDGSPEWVLESAKARAVFSTQDGGRWMEFTAKDGGVNFLPEQGLLAGAGRVSVQETAGGLEFSGPGWKRTARLAEGTLTIEQTAPLPEESLGNEKRGDLTFTVERRSPAIAVYTIK